MSSNSFCRLTKDIVFLILIWYNFILEYAEFKIFAESEQKKKEINEKNTSV